MNTIYEAFTIDHSPGSATRSQWLLVYGLRTENGEQIMDKGFAGGKA